MATVVVMKQGDRDPPITATLQDRNGAVAFAGTEPLKFVMRLPGATESKVFANASWVTPASGTVRYTWAAGDTDTPGVYVGEFRVTLATGNVITFPNAEHITVTILESVHTTADDT